MSVFKIEKGIPMPPATLRQGSNIQLLRTMEPGESVFFDAPIVAKAVRFYRVAKKLGVTIAIRKESEGVRMWKLDAGPARVNPAVAKQVASAVVARASSAAKARTKGKAKARTKGRVTA